jgi:hypothetical protein
MDQDSGLVLDTDHKVQETDLGSELAWVSAWVSLSA